jgi:two-component system OmpR family response regulator
VFQCEFKIDSSSDKCGPETGRSLSQKEFALLEFLMRHAGEVVSRTAIAEHVWDLHFDPMSNTIDVYINFLRKKIGETPSKSKIETVRGTGYRLACP